MKKATSAMCLSEFQDAFSAALLAKDTNGESDAILGDVVQQPGFAVYRNTVLKGCIDALQANFPAVARLTGEPWFRAAAAVFVGSNLPRQPSLFEYGSGFPEFLERFEPAAELTYLADVARLDRCWTESHAASDDPPLTAAELAALSSESLARVVLRPHATARWLWFADAPIYSIWRANHDGSAALPDELAWRGEGALLTRPGGRVDAMLLERGDCAFLDGCRAGARLLQAGLDTLTVAPTCDLAAVLQRLLNAGAFTRMADDQHCHQETP